MLIHKPSNLKVFLAHITLKPQLLSFIKIDIQLIVIVQAAVQEDGLEAVGSKELLERAERIGVVLTEEERGLGVVVVEGLVDVVLDVRLVIRGSCAVVAEGVD